MKDAVITILSLLVVLLCAAISYHLNHEQNTDYFYNVTVSDEYAIKRIDKLEGLIMAFSNRMDKLEQKPEPVYVPFNLYPYEPMPYAIINGDTMFSNGWINGVLNTNACIWEGL